MNEKQTGFFEALGEKPPEPKKAKEEKRTHPTIRYVEVEAQTSAGKYKVDLFEGVCSCSAPVGEGCFHLRKARDVHLNKCAKTRHEAVSAMHKEIRRGDVQASLYWADILSRHSDYYVKRYVRQIVGEETRNWNLYWMALRPGEHSYRDMVGAIASSRKKWEHKNVCRPFKEQLKAFWDLNESNYDFKPGEELIEETRAALKRDDMPLIFKLFAAIECKEEDETTLAFEHVLCEEVEHRFEDMKNLKFFMEKYPGWTGRDNWENRLTMIEMLTGAWDKTMNEFIHDPEGAYEYDDGALLKKFPDYVYDKHLIQGQRRLEKYFDKIGPMKPMPDKLDMRWSGQFMGVSWRYAAYVQFGDNYVNARWEDVKWSKEFWEYTLSMQKACEG
jgi:hypothetical protein